MSVLLIMIIDVTWCFFCATALLVFSCVLKCENNYNIHNIQKKTMQPKFTFTVQKLYENMWTNIHFYHTHVESYILSLSHVCSWRSYTYLVLFFIDKHYSWIICDTKNLGSLIGKAFAGNTRVEGLYNRQGYTMSIIKFF